MTKSMTSNKHQYNLKQQFKLLNIMILLLSLDWPHLFLICLNYLYIIGDDRHQFGAPEPLKGDEDAPANSLDK